MKDVFLNVSNVSVGGDRMLVSYVMLGLIKNARCISKCSSSQKINLKSPNIVSISKNGEEKEEAKLSNARKEENKSIKLQLKLMWRQFKG